MNNTTCAACGAPADTLAVAIPRELPPGGLYSIEELPWTEQWEPRCRGCVGGDYAIPLDEIADHVGLLRWSAHLAEKEWLSATDWSRVLREATS